MSEGVPITVWINGFGSIGRCLARIVARRSSISLNGDTNWAAPGALVTVRCFFITVDPVLANLLDENLAEFQPSTTTKRDSRTASGSGG
jgi:hypothetical protein